MELVYLWVEDYKNIKKQGFNFSPKFECRYDENTKELTIDEKKDYVSIFPDNINVTAIVGKNGAGKSTIQKLIFLLIFLKKYENFTADNPIDIEKKDAIIEIFKNDIFKDKNIFLIVNTSIGLKKISLLQSIQNYDNPTINSFKSNTKTCLLQTQYTELKPDEIDFFSIHFHYMIDSWFDGYHTADDWTLNLYHRVDGFKTPLLLEPYKGHNRDNQYIDIGNIEYLNNQHMFDFYGQLTEELEFNKFFNPDSIWMMIDTKKLIEKFEKFDGFPNIEIPVKIITEYIYELAHPETKDLIRLNKLYVLIKIIYSNNDIFSDTTIIQSTRNKIINIKTEDELIKLINSFTFDTLLKTTGLNETKKLEACIEFDLVMKEDTTKLEAYKEFLVFDPSNSKINNVKEVRDIFENILPWIEVEFYDKNKGYSSLSSGEKAFLNFAMNLLYQIDNIKRNGNYKTINLFLDEVEYSLHPEWQREFLNQVLFLLKNFDDLQFNLFFATHSPFLLSDIPKENVIFLEKGTQVYPNIETFGANIHTLLSHGFFMKDGLMGEFAKRKINEAIKYLNQKTLSEDEINYCENIISIVGEPILKRQLQRMSDSKRLTKIDDIDKKIKDMEYELSILKKYQNKATNDEMKDRAKRKYSKKKTDDSNKK